MIDFFANRFYMAGFTQELRSLPTLRKLLYDDKNPTE